MAFPTITEVVETQFSTTTGNFDLDNPAAVDSGDLLMAAVYKNGSDGGEQFTWPAGWTQLEDDGGIPVFSVAYRIADGTEDGGTTGVTASVNQTGLGFIAQVKNWHGTTPPEIVATPASGTGTGPDSASLTPSWGAEDTAFWSIMVADYDSGSDGVSGTPTNYSHLTDGTTSSPFELDSTGAIAVATRNLNATSDDPGAFTIAQSQQWKAVTLAIRPSASGGGSITPTSFTENTTFGTAVITGGVQGVTPSSISESTTFGSHTIEAVISIVFSDPFHNGSSLLTNESGLTAYVLNASTKALVATVSSLSTDASGFLDDVEDVGLSASTNYRVIVDGFSGGEEAYIRDAST